MIVASLDRVFRYHGGQFDASGGWAIGVAIFLLCALAIWKGHDLF